MPKIYDNIESQLKNGLITTLESSYRADFCVGYFNLRGWKLVENQIDLLEGGEDCCRLLVGMQRPEEELLRSALSRIDEGMMDNSRALDHKKKIARSFRQQLTFGLPTAKDEESLQKLKQQLVHEKVKVKLFLDYPLHAKNWRGMRENHDKGYPGQSGIAGPAQNGLSLQPPSTSQRCAQVL